jgi:hypothetical protein
MGPPMVPIPINPTFIFYLLFTRLFEKMSNYYEEQKPLDMMDFSPARSGSHRSMMNMWERLPAAIETNPSDIGYGLKLVLHFSLRQTDY